MRLLACGFTALTLLLTVAPAARAQERPIELGIDGALTVFLEDPRVVTLGVPIEQFRIGFFTSPTVSIEPAFAFNYLRADDFNVAQLSLNLGVLLHFAPIQTQSQTYFRPFAGFTTISVEGDSESSGRLGAGVGIRNRFANRLATRFEGFLAHDFEGDGTTSVGLLFGISFFPR